MTLKEFDTVALSDYMVGVNKEQAFIEEFSCHNKGKIDKYKDAIITSIHVLNENEFAVNIELK